MEILDRDNPILRETAEVVPLDKISSPKIQKIIERMKQALLSQDDGVAIAAPQIGESFRIFVVSGRVKKIANKNKVESADEKDEDLVFINPEILSLSKKKKKMEEGCLSVRWLYGEVERSEKAKIKAYDEKGKLVERGSSGLMAQIFQHEIDHLNGILFIDKAENVQNLPPEENDSNE